MDAYSKRSNARQSVIEHYNNGWGFVEIREDIGNRYGFGERFVKKMIQEYEEYRAAVQKAKTE